MIYQMVPFPMTVSDS